VAQLSTAEAIMSKYPFTDEYCQEVERLREMHPVSRERCRLDILHLRTLGLDHQSIAKFAQLSRRQVHRVVKKSHEQGVESVTKFLEKGPENQLLAHKDRIAAQLQENPPATAAEAAERIFALTGIRRSLTQIRKFLRDELGLAWLKTKAVPVPPKQTLEEHVETQKQFLETSLQPRIDEAESGKRALFFMDASHMVLGSFVAYLWCVRALFIRSASGRQRYNVLGAINPLTWQFFRVCNTGYINSHTICALLNQIAAAGLTIPITIVLDNASYQRCQLVQSLAKELNIELLFLPSYSPNLNLIERVWKFVKKQALNSRHHTNFAEFQGRIDKCLDDLGTTHREELKSLLTLNFQTFEGAHVLAA